MTTKTEYQEFTSTKRAEARKLDNLLTFHFDEPETDIYGELKILVPRHSIHTKQIIAVLEPLKKSKIRIKHDFKSFFNYLCTLSNQMPIHPNTGNAIVYAYKALL